MRMRILAAMCVSSSLVLTGCGLGDAITTKDEAQKKEAAEERKAREADPRKSDVLVFDRDELGHGVNKRCDGSTLVYATPNGGIAVVSDSPECKK
jgi:hypothetical protein